MRAAHPPGRGGEYSSQHAFRPPAVPRRFKALFPNAGKRVVEKGVTHKYVVPPKGQAAAQPTDGTRLMSAAGARAPR